MTILDQFTVPPLITDPLSYSPPHPPIPDRMYNGVVYFVSYFPTTTMLAPLGQGIWTVDICNSPPRTVGILQCEAVAGGGRGSVVSLCDPMDCSPPGSSIHGISQARILDRVAMFSSKKSSRPRDGTHVSCVCHIGRQVLHHWATCEAPWTGANSAFIVLPLQVPGMW